MVRDRPWYSSEPNANPCLPVSNTVLLALQKQGVGALPKGKAFWGSPRPYFFPVFVFRGIFMAYWVFGDGFNLYGH